LDQAPPSFAEDFRELNANVRSLLGQKSKRERLRCIVLISAPTGIEGVTSIAVNLGAAAARVGSHVVLVDVNFRKPALSESFGLMDGRGFSEVLTGAATVGDCLADAGIAGLSVLPAGGADRSTATLLSSDRCRAVLEDLAVTADIVILDCAPVLAVADTLELASVADLTLLIVRHGKSKYRQTAAAIDRMGRVGASVDGIVLNDVTGR